MHRFNWQCSWQSARNVQSNYLYFHPWASMKGCKEKCPVSTVRALLFLSLWAKLQHSVVSEAVLTSTWIIFNLRNDNKDTSVSVYLIATKLKPNCFSSFGLISPLSDSLLIFFFLINLLLFPFQALAQLQLIDYIGEQTALLIKVSFPFDSEPLQSSLRSLCDWHRW